MRNRPVLNEYSNPNLNPLRLMCCLATVPRSEPTMPLSNEDYKVNHVGWLVVGRKKDYYINFIQGFNCTL